MYYIAFLSIEYKDLQIAPLSLKGILVDNMVPSDAITVPLFHDQSMSLIKEKKIRVALSHLKGGILVFRS